VHLVGSVAVAHVLDGLGTVCNGCHDFVCMGDGWSCDVFVAELGCVGEAFALGRLDVAQVGSVMFGRSRQVPSIHRMVSPCAALVCLLVHLDCASHGRQRHLVVIEWPA
jgi:hypothetical protein